MAFFATFLATLIWPHGITSYTELTLENSFLRGHRPFNEPGGGDSRGEGRAGQDREQDRRLHLQALQGGLRRRLRPRPA